MNEYTSNIIPGIANVFVGRQIVAKNAQKLFVSRRTLTAIGTVLNSMKY